MAEINHCAEVQSLEIEVDQSPVNQETFDRINIGSLSISSSISSSSSSSSNNNNNNNNNNNHVTIHSEALLDLLHRTGYPLVQENGQRRYGPPAEWQGPVPCRGCEVFVGKLPRDCFEDELVPVLEKAGQIYECRIMVDYERGNRGFCFATYATREEARRAVNQLNNYEIRERRYIGVCSSVDNCRLFVGGIPLDKKEDDVTREMRQVSDGVVRSIVYPSVGDKTKNRGFAFVEYESHKAAAVARRKLMPGKIPLWGQQVAVDWAEPEAEVDEDVMSKVKILYVRNLMTSTTEETIFRTFQEAIGKTDGIEKVKKLKDFAFVHFKEREDALTAMGLLNDTLLDGSRIVVVLAKPPNKDSTQGSHGKAHKVVMAAGAHFYRQAPHFVPHTAFYPMTAAPFGRPLPNKVNGDPVKVPEGEAATAVGQSGRGRSHPGARKAGGMSRSYGGSGGNAGSNKQQVQLFDLRPGTELVPINPHTLKPIHVSKSPVQALEELCGRNGWEMPVYHLHSAVNIPGDQQLFAFKVLIPSVSPAAFVPPKLCRSIDDAKKIAAEFVLLSLGMAPAGAFNGAVYHLQGEYCY